MAASDAHAAYRGVTVAVLGASGFIGRWVARALAEHGATLALVARDAASLSERRAGLGASTSVIEADLAREGTACEIVEATRPAVVFNLAGYGVDPGERDEHAARTINTELPRRIVQALAARRDDAWCGQRLVHVGSALEYGDAGGDLAEGSPPRPTTLYGRSKLAGTLAVSRGCAELGVRGVTARLFTVYGAGEHAGRLLPTLLDAVRHDDPIPLTAGLQQRDFTYVEDVAEGLLRLGSATAARPGEVVNLATGRLTEVRRFAAECALALGLDPARLVFGALPTRAEEMRHEPVSVARLRELVGWVPPTTVPDGIRRTIARAAEP
ncbi:MAG TPA: NAD(P)-dependent oxidoreductase [Gemmatimonadaceae bacterium]|nr:NAD(P)-dependent oxidoreductase [Gemmatimonadaceae bacterium]